MKSQAWLLSKGIFFKKIPLRGVIIPKSIKDLTDWMNRQISFNPYTKSHQCVCESPYADRGTYHGIETDLRSYDVTTGPFRGNRGGTILT